MSTLGRTTTSGNDTWYANQGSNNQVGFRVVATEDGLATDCSVYVSGNNGDAPDMCLCIWNASGTLLARSNHFTCPGGGTGINGQSLQSQSLQTPLQLTNGGIYIVGFWRDPSKWAAYSTNSGSGTTAKQGGSNLSAPGTISRSNDVTEQMTAYITYEPGGAYVKQSGGSMTRRQVQVRQSGGTWTTRTDYVKQGDGSWQAAG